ncbi:HD domain-containing phosphohydrolase [Caloramator proteoclasticus]|uniref:HDIG domain-containing protein n=1 Tax=Caloramator proteoclasticus DSM 10124 TaxID=1121262 RepID=A0A1M4VLG9_9CLOT|nr:HD domain-containing phosphohydrolase [Caloramator proteoclasticus]SHE69673.1 HDIG domain-containing protein [Caloramator proteoclasticus DSM 10124]
MERLDLHQIVASLAFSVDLAETSTIADTDFEDYTANLNLSKHKFLNHARRATYVALRVAKMINDDENFLSKVFIATALHDIGIKRDIDSAHSDFDIILEHSKLGEALILRLPVDKELASIIKYHHENFNGTGVYKLKGEDIPLISRIIRLADIFEILYDETKSNFIQRNRINEWINEHKNSLFDPNIVDVYNKVQFIDAFWLDIENIAYTNQILDKIIPETKIPATLEDIKRIAEVFAYIIDHKSHFTYTHSTNLAKYVKKVCNYIGFDKNKTLKMEIAALLHDIGKLSIPNSILDKNGKLTAEEMQIMRSHTYYTRLILSKIDGFEEIAEWAANHHEKLNGKGYPLGLDADKLSLESRIMAICDIYEALTADRPYRAGMSADDAFKIIQTMVKSGELCNKAFTIVKKALSE